MTVRESIQNEIYALEDAKRSMEDLLAKLASYSLELPDEDLDGFGSSPYDYDGHIFYETRDHMAALRNVVIPGLETLINSNKDDLRSFPETILEIDLVKMNNRLN